MPILASVDHSREAASGARVGGLPNAHRADARALVVGVRGESGRTVCASAGSALARLRRHAFTPVLKARLNPLGCVLVERPGRYSG